MALIELGPMVSGITGSIGGTTYARTRYGFVAKRKSQPVNPSTPAQTQIRAWMTQAVANWKHVLTAAEIATWIHGAQLHKRSHIGVGFELSGINLYVACYIGLWKCGQTPPTECTIFEGAPEINLPGINDAAQGRKQIATELIDDADHLQMFYASDAVSPGINYKSVPFVWNTVLSDGMGGLPVLIDVIYPAVDTPFNIFLGTRVFDKRGAVSSLLTWPVSGLTVV